MLLHDTCSDPGPSHARLPACPECGDRILAPLLAEHISARHVRNHWVCESCGHSFHKSFSVAVAEEEIAG